MTDLLKLDGVAHRKRGKEELTSFPDILLREGNAICLSGASGSGKSLVLKIAAGILKPTQGNITCASVPRAYIFKEDGLLNNYSVWDNLMLPLIFSSQQGGLEERANDALHRFELANIKNDIVGGLPQPPKKLLQYARALVLNPKILFIEEPLKNIRSEHYNQVKTWLKEYILQEKAGCLFTSVSSEQWGDLKPQCIRLSGGGVSFKTIIEE